MMLSHEAEGFYVSWYSRDVVIEDFLRSPVLKCAPCAIEWIMKYQMAKTRWDRVKEVAPEKRLRGELIGTRTILGRTAALLKRGITLTRCWISFRGSEYILYWKTPLFPKAKRCLVGSKIQGRGSNISVEGHVWKPRKRMTPRERTLCGEFARVTRWRMYCLLLKYGEGKKKDHGGSEWYASRHGGKKKR
jgi:hypothetical protein